MRIKDNPALNSKVNDVEVAVWKHFMPDDKTSNGLDDSRMYLACWVLEDTIECLLQNGISWEDIESYLWATVCDMDGARELKVYIEDKVNFARARRAAEIRMDFASAFRGVREGRRLSGDLKYGFSPEDISNLARLHKSNKFRKKIEDLLEDCNFHKECGDFSVGNYEPYLTGGKV